MARSWILRGATIYWQSCAKQSFDLGLRFQTMRSEVSTVCWNFRTEGYVTADKTVCLVSCCRKFRNTIEAVCPCNQICLKSVKQPIINSSQCFAFPAKITSANLNIFRTIQGVGINMG
ncbi:hypothetical protein HW555_011629 [Spodoptera exigua]|uniref:Uncharacterized protein n=1 Tax=Spodoptera exigua TaxID=7107 RepID=A0A835L0E6_SPOEX|nr:hypothetical protein HW555_011629 [Spodoptera exigua]